ncbi:hypothetical protein MACH17_18600 [Phaeobacter inhibens]|uniref:Bbp16 family capsid cement protein n=1 Tax=Phaeobacter inhibens TaxID=221822 RepID=UPI0027511F50|nr:hypothetical protein [Phaeobacter inhibens]GLO70343.1 hypothetical protein MACH17_18600 [Phaeobacter inhibens]
MILDKNLILAENQAVTATAISQNIIQLPASGTVYGEGSPITRNLGPGEEVPILIQVVEDFATLTSLTITLETADNAALSTNAQVLFSTGAIPLAQLVAGYRTPIRVLPDFPLRDFVGLRFTVTGSNATAGKLTAAIGTEVNAG